MKAIMFWNFSMLILKSLPPWGILKSINFIYLIMRVLSRFDTCKSAKYWREIFKIVEKDTGKTITMRSRDNSCSTCCCCWDSFGVNNKMLKSMSSKTDNLMKLYICIYIFWVLYTDVEDFPKKICSTCRKNL